MYCIKILSEGKNFFVFLDRHPDPGNFRPALEAGYLMTNGTYRVARDLDRIYSGHQEKYYVSASKPPVVSPA